MLEINPVFWGALKNEMLGLDAKHRDIWDQMIGHENKTLPDKKPFVQIGYDEIPGEELDKLLGFSGIAQANRPIGLPVDFNAFTWQTTSGSEALLFPLSGLYSHFRVVAPEICRAYEASGSMDSFAGIRGDAMTAAEYLVGGSMECISFCERRGAALVFRW